MKYRATEAFTYDRLYEAGEIVEELTDLEIQNLINCGSIEAIESSDEPAPPKDNKIQAQVLKRNKSNDPNESQA